MHLNILHTKNLDIFEQLKLEEALIKKSDSSFCIINEGSKRAIVLGCSNNPNSLINYALLKKENIPLIKRFSGGGTVVVDQNTIFVSFIFSKELLCFSFPEQIFRWSEVFYKKIFDMPFFSFKENDYIIKGYKCGGNAQYIRKNRWLHHTSFLWDFDSNNMQYLLMPEKKPLYRKNRDHSSFLCKLKDHFSDKTLFIEKIKIELEKSFEVKKLSLKDLYKKTENISCDLATTIL